MLQKILFSVSKFQKEKFFSDSPKEKNFSCCEKCGGENFYLPIKSNRWECRECNPPRSERFVAQSKQGRRSEDTTLEGPTEPEPVKVDPAQCWGPYVLRAENPICECGSKYFQESGTVCNVKKFCVCCRSEIFLVDFA
jgi:hypothetical protein